MIAKPETLNEVVSTQSQTTGVIREIQDIERDLTLSVIRKNDFPGKRVPGNRNKLFYKPLAFAGAKN